MSRQGGGSTEGLYKAQTSVDLLQMTLTSYHIDNTMEHAFVYKSI